MKLLLILLLLNFKVFAKTVKFHAPQTEAERVLDGMLMINQDTKKYSDSFNDISSFLEGVHRYMDVKNYKNTYSHLFSKGFLKASYEKFDEKISNYTGKKNEIDTIHSIFGKFQLDCTVNDKLKIKTFLYNTLLKDGNKFYIAVDYQINFRKSANKFEHISDVSLVYALKHEDGIYKIDGMFCKIGDEGYGFEENINFDNVDMIIANRSS